MKQKKGRGKKRPQKKREKWKKRSKVKKEKRRAEKSRPGKKRKGKERKAPSLLVRVIRKGEACYVVVHKFSINTKCYSYWSNIAAAAALPRIP